MSAGPIFLDINADDPEVSIIESLCMNCHEQGQTRIFPTKIPFFKEMIIMSFKCEHCNYANNEVQSGGKIELNGSKIICIVNGTRDHNRQVIKSEHCTVSIPELDFEVPPRKQGGEMTTIEGLITKACENLRQTASINVKDNPDWSLKVLEFCTEKLEKILERKFTLVLNDPSGYSMVENLHLPYPDPCLEIRYYGRTKEQDEALGIAHNPVDINAESEATEDFDAGQEVMSIPEICSNCSIPAMCRIKQVRIPFFKEVTIMAVTCEGCGYRSNEVKAGGGIEPKGKKYILRVETKEDVARDILKSDTASILIPELDWEIGMGCIAGKFTTLEGILQDLKTDLIDRNPFAQGDAQTSERGKRFQIFKATIAQIMALEIPWTFILDDPAGNSYILSLTAPEPDSQLQEVFYDRTWQQNEDMGLNDIQTENYESI